jgi:hypothetical protein
MKYTMNSIRNSTRTQKMPTQMPLFPGILLSVSMSGPGAASGSGEEIFTPDIVHEWRREDP